MDVAVAFRRQTEHERRENKHSYALFRTREAESLPYFIEPEGPDLFQVAKVLNINSDIELCAAAKSELRAHNTAMKGKPSA